MDIYSELYHHGVKGQHWGVRRYQNKDGSLTAEGYQHWGLNPDGSRHKQHGTMYTPHTTKRTKQGALLGLAAGAALTAATGGTAIAAAGAMGVTGFVGIYGGMAVGTIQTRMTQKKIRKMLSEKGTVYVKDL